MTFEEIDQKLPNGFHDAKIRNICMDLIDPSLVIEMELHASEYGEPDRERYRSGTLRIGSPSLFFIEAPDPRYPFVPDGAPLNVDGDSVEVGQNSDLDRLLPVLPQNSSIYRFFLEEWNSFIYLGGGNVDFSWDDGEVLEGGG